ncbi:hypothetical protein HY024_03910 [Candidatus Curtissbacteria bacterium]|nr:hypothetical protein [Candidatus Curtissbacteria bacterium]
MVKRSKFKISNKVIYFATVVLFINALLLGYLILRKQNVVPDLFQFPKKSYVVPAVLPALSDEQRVMRFPTPNSPDKVKVAHTALVQKLAQQSDYLDIGKCAPKPLVFKITVGDFVNLRNLDTVDHTLSFNPETQFLVAAGTTRQVKADFFKIGPGVYAYGCDKSSQAVGILLAV